MRTALIRCVWLLVGAALLFAAPQQGAPPLPFVSPIFGDHMVLQRGKPNAIWGWSTPGDKVRIELAERSATAVAGTDGRWQAHIEPPAAGGTYMSLAGRGGPFRRGPWGGRGGGISAVAYFFGRRLQEDSHIPIGLVHEAVGGVLAETFTSPEALRPLKDFDDGIAEVERRRQKADPEYGNYIMHWLDEYDIGAKTTSWADPARDESSWKTVRLPGGFKELGVDEVPNVSWFRREIRLPDTLPEGMARLYLGSIDKMDTADAAMLNQKLKVLWIGCGTEDPGYNGVKGMDELLSKKGVKHVWNESGGGHSWPNWQVYLSKYAPLLFRD